MNTLEKRYISKEVLQKQCENIIGEGEGYLKGEVIREVLNDIDGFPTVIYWGCIDEKMLDERF